ncbi:uncharacterized protein N7518_007579 [Penicillium psychrosexuale]|uniref:uncharacterized protein n=1 Tax=Penicillium psychrosexuale TaxID=1002107 RepID=UPI002545B6A3|nr:uncharacterized protein N7518_007579 [Penicillium psychrosexuale]KAJ5790568.1 hypothetical protein N7518_007579 [Penicillium psychrosexuale]
MEYVLVSLLPSSAPRHERQKNPLSCFGVPGSEWPMLGLGDEDVAGAGFKGFYPIVALQMMDLHTLAVKFRHENDIRCSSDRWGASLRG